MNCSEVNVRRTLKRASQSAVLLAAIFFAASPLLAQTPSVNGVMIAYGKPTAWTNQISISGTFLNPKAIAPTVVLGVTTLTVTSSSNTRIVATFPSTLAPGAYLLTVMNHPYSYTGVFTVTNGAVGPQGHIAAAEAKGAARKNRTTGTDRTTRSAGGAGAGAAGTAEAPAPVSISSLCSVLFPNAPAADCAGTPRTTAKTVFVTAGAYSGNLNGTAGGNAICQKEAESAGLAGTYKAWLSTATTSDEPPQPLARIASPAFPGGYILTDGVAATASNRPPLTATALHNGNSSDDHGVSLLSRATAGDPLGTNLNATGTESACNGWSISTSAANGTGGAYAGAVPSNPDALQEQQIVECGPAHYLYCIQQ